MNIHNTQCAHTHILPQACLIKPVSATLYDHCSTESARSFVATRTMHEATWLLRRRCEEISTFCQVLAEAGVTATKGVPRTRNPGARQANSNPEQPRKPGTGKFYVLPAVEQTKKPRVINLSALRQFTGSRRRKPLRTKPHHFRNQKNAG